MPPRSTFELTEDERYAKALARQEADQGVAAFLAAGKKITVVPSRLPAGDKPLKEHQKRKKG